MFLVIVQEREELVVLCLVLIVNFVPVVVLSNEGLLLDLLLKSLGPGDLGLEEVEEDVRVEERSDALDLLSGAIR